MSQKRVSKSKNPYKKKSSSKNVKVISPLRLGESKFHRTIKKFLGYMEDRWFLAGRFIIRQLSSKMITLEPRYKTSSVDDVKRITSDALRLHGIPKEKVIFDSKKNVIIIFGTE